MEEATFQRALAYLAAAYDREVTKERAAVYWDQLGNLEDEPFLEAVQMVVGTDERFPTVARLRGIYRQCLQRRRTALPYLPQIDKQRGLDHLARLREALK